jgi:hypothetical protein
MSICISLIAPEHVSTLCAEASDAFSTSSRLSLSWEIAVQKWSVRGVAWSVGRGNNLRLTKLLN